MKKQQVLFLMMATLFVMCLVSIPAEVWAATPPAGTKGTGNTFWADVKHAASTAWHWVQIAMTNFAVGH